MTLPQIWGKVAARTRVRRVMAPTLNTAAGRKQRLNSLINLVDEGVAERIKLTADLRPTIPAMFEALQQLALGVRVQEDRVSNDGKPYKYTYERAPNIKAIDLLLRYANVTPEDTANMLLSYVRAEATVAEVDARLASYKAQNLAAQTAFTD